MVISCGHIKQIFAEKKKRNTHYFKFEKISALFEFNQASIEETLANDSTALCN